MRIYNDCYDLMSEICRDVLEMGVKVHPNSMQNKRVVGNDLFSTKEVIAYDYCLLSLARPDYLFVFDNDSVEWTKAELKERINPLAGNPGEAWMKRPNTWAQFLNSLGQFDYTYSERLNSNRSLATVIEELSKNPDSRQAILSIWDRRVDIHNVGGKARIPCSIYYQILVRDSQVNIIYNQRSADVVTHFGNDIWLAWNLMEYITTSLVNLGLSVVPGYLYHNIGSLHVYQKDIQLLESWITNLPKK